MGKSIIIEKKTRRLNSLKKRHAEFIERNGHECSQMISEIDKLELSISVLELM